MASGTPTLADLVATSGAVAATSGRSAKRDALAELLGRLPAEEVAVAAGFLTGEPRQGRIGIGWRTLSSVDVDPASAPSLSLVEVDAALDALDALEGPGSAGRRRELLADLLGRATAEEAAFLTRLLGGELRQGASAGVMTDAVARAADVPATAVRRAAMLGGDLPTIAALAVGGGAEALGAIGLELGRPVQPMLAATAPSVTDAVDGVGRAVVEWKLDGIRIQVHRRGDDVRIWTRNLNDITARLPEVVALVRALPARDLVLDGEALVVDDADRPVLFQDTASRVSADEVGDVAVRPWFFDLLHRDGRDLLDAPLAERRGALAEVAPALRVPGEEVDDPRAGDDVLVAALAAGHEGVVVKDAAAPYQAGRRGKAWRKVKPVHTLDLVVLAAEWGHGRRRGWLSNLHLGARADDGDGLVMVGKTFKGLTDELLTWQTEALLARQVAEERSGSPQTGVVHVRPELVVEVALDGVQRSTRYPGGVALRFARVVRYRPDKTPDQADTLTAVRAVGQP
ncbi:ATP-dependent DNA ligase [Iamia majanohamensis]|uniref:DNA ligase n=1 Tax=Iamia majanohamensis TaxID=467976 RepID=A0AAE9Y6U6_9ACTN|nr:ATP-dependent DNA ligase [Iamia majanohamensis]WCO66676.1 ATP-dependent DNA ligase [Iamia majanohamensis]